MKFVQVPLINGKKPKIVLAYSGGLDTSTILKWLILKGYDVITFTADIGQIDDDLKKIELKAKKMGAIATYSIDVKKEFVTDYIFTVFKTGAKYENSYLLGTSIARPLIAKKQIEIALKEGAQFVSHGCTGKGNDQVRFELSYLALNPNIKIFVPWKDTEFLNTFEGRADLLQFAEAYNIPVSQTIKQPWSEDENLLHISHEAGIIEDVEKEVPDSVYNRSNTPQKAPDKTSYINLHFISGVPAKLEILGVNKKIVSTIIDPLKIFIELNKIGALNGIGHLDMVENRFVGMKSRGIYETPAGTIISIAHHDLEGLTLDREVMNLSLHLNQEVAKAIYNGMWYAPEFPALMGFFDVAQKNVTGWVQLKLYKGNCYPVARGSEYSLYSNSVASMDIAGGYNQQDAIGFIKLQAIRILANSKVNHIALSQKKLKK